MRASSRKAFTLVEVIAMIVVIIILAAIGIWRYRAAAPRCPKRGPL